MIPSGRNIVPVLVYADIAVAHEFLITAFGFSPGQVHRDSDGRAVHGEVSINGEAIWLHPVAEKHGLRSVRELKAATGMLNVFVDDVDAHHAHAAHVGASIISPPTDQTYGQREYSVSDTEGRIWSFATRKGLPHE